MNGYLAFLKIRIKTLLQYRSAAFAAIATQLFWGFVNVMIYRAFYATAVAPPISLNQAMTFIWLNQAFLQLIPWTIDKEIEAQVRNGNVVYELIRPIVLYKLWFVSSFALRFTRTLMRCIPVFLVGGFLGLSAPVSFQASLCFIVSLGLGLLLSTAIMTVVMISLFWTISGEGIQRLLPHVSLFFSGMIVPLPLFPYWMQNFLNFQPFRAIIDIPCRLYTGVIPTADAFLYFGVQFGWFIFFLFLGKWLIDKAMKNFVVQGG